MNALKEQNSNSKKTSAIEQLRELIAHDLSSMDALIRERSKSDTAKLVQTVAEHIASAGGKRIRPILTISCAKLFDIKNDSHILLAAAVEFIHTATLLHDDVIDESPTRRGVLTSHQIWGNKASILVGDYLFSQAFRMMVETGSIEALGVLSKTSAIIAEGEVWQLSNIRNTSITKDEYFALVRSKTAQLFSAACEAGGIVAGCGKEDASLLAEYGMSLGIAFQIIDDMLDYTADSEIFGKQPGTDFREGKLTLPYIIALERASSKDRESLVDSIAKSETQESFQSALLLLRKYEAFAEAKATAHQSIKTGLNAIAQLKQSNILMLLADLIKELVDRAH